MGHTGKQGDSVSNRQSSCLRGLKGDLLRKHNVAWDERTDRREAPADPFLAVPIKLPNICRGSVAYPVTFAAVGTSYIKISGLVELRALSGGKPIPQQTSATRFAGYSPHAWHAKACEPISAARSHVP
jgi:hypothetical protein